MVVKVEAYHDGIFWCGRGIGADFFTQGKTLDDLMRNVKDAASLHFEGTRKREWVISLLLIGRPRVSLQARPH